MLTMITKIDSTISRVCEITDWKNTLSKRFPNEWFDKGCMRVEMEFLFEKQYGNKTSWKITKDTK